MVFQSLKEWEKINEIGDASADSFPFQYDGKSNKEFGRDTYFYSFIAGGDKYISVFIERQSDEEKYYEYHYNREGKDGTEIINRGHLFKIMATNTRIIKDFIKKENVDNLIISGDTGGKVVKGMQSRLKLYSAYLDKNMITGYDYLIFRGEDDDIENILIRRKK